MRKSQDGIREGKFYCTYAAPRVCISNSKESIQPAHVARTTLFLIGCLPPQIVLKFQNYPMSMQVQENMSFIVSSKYRASIFKKFQEPRNRFLAWRNRFLGSIKRVQIRAQFLGKGANIFAVKYTGKANFHVFFTFTYKQHHSGICFEKGKFTHITIN